MSEYLGRDMLTTQDWTLDELKDVIRLANLMKENRYSPQFTKLLENRTFLMFFYNPSVRTRQSFEAAMTELGGHAQFLEPKSMRLKTKKTAGETIEDAAQVMSRYAAGLGIRMLEDKVSAYGQGAALLKEYAKWASIPVLSMADDKYHPFQALADIMGAQNHLGKNLKGKKLLMYWGHGALARSWCSVQENMLLSSKLGMDVTLAHPEGYDLDPEIIKQVQKQCEANGQKFEITHSPTDGFDGADVVYARNWMSPNAYHDGELHKQEEIEKAMKYPEWIYDGAKMKNTNSAIFTHPMPVDRGHEVSDEVASGKNSIIYEVAGNRLHVQKAVMALTMAGYEI